MNFKFSFRASISIYCSWPRKQVIIATLEVELNLKRIMLFSTSSRIAENPASLHLYNGTPRSGTYSLEDASELLNETRTQQRICFKAKAMFDASKGYIKIHSDLRTKKISNSQITFTMRRSSIDWRLHSPSCSRPRLETCPTLGTPKVLRLHVALLLTKEEKADVLESPQPYRTNLITILLSAETQHGNSSSATVFRQPLMLRQNSTLLGSERSIAIIRSTG